MKQDPRRQRHEVRRDRIPRRLLRRTATSARRSDKTRKLLFDACEGARAAGTSRSATSSTRQAPMPQTDRRVRRAVPGGREARHHDRLRAHALLRASTRSRALRQLVEGAAQKNGGVIFDLWHIVKLGIPYDEGHEVPEAVLHRPRDQRRLSEDARRHGHGHRDHLAPQALRLRRVRHQGLSREARAARTISGPVGIEVLSQELRSWPLEKTATTAFDTTLAQFPADT